MSVERKRVLYHTWRRAEWGLGEVVPDRRLWRVSKMGREYVRKAKKAEKRLSLKEALAEASMV